jgi:uncharacterized membrane protein YhaH (DUF805 family)
MVKELYPQIERSRVVDSVDYTDHGAEGGGAALPVVFTPSICELGEAVLLSAFLRSTITCFRKYAVFRGRAGREEFWYFLLFFFVAYAVVIAADMALVAMGFSAVTLRDLPFGVYLPLSYALDEAGLLILLYRPVMLLPSTAATVRRLHDIDRSGWWAWLWILPVPMLGWFLLIPWLARPSGDSTNRYGNPNTS